MKALVYYAPNDLRLEETLVPVIQPDQALVRVLSACICGTDLRILHGKHRLYHPGVIRIPGHEVVGEIVQVGSQVVELEVDQRVFIAPNMGCGHCPQCISGNNNLCKEYEAIGLTMDGAFAEFMLLPSQAIKQGNCIPISKEVDPAAQALIEPLACVYRGQQAVNIQPGDQVLVIGAGPIGIMHALLASFRGASQVIISELVKERANCAREFGFTHVITPPDQDIEEIVLELTSGHGPDVVIVAAPSSQAQAQACNLAALQGRINFFGGLPQGHAATPLDSNLIHYKELVITGTTACSTHDCWQAARILNSERMDISKIITNRFSLNQALEAFRVAESRQALKVCLDIASGD